MNQSDYVKCIIQGWEFNNNYYEGKLIADYMHKVVSIFPYDKHGTFFEIFNVKYPNEFAASWKSISDQLNSN